MSMKLLTIFQFAGIFCAYLFLSFGCPAAVFHGRFRKTRWPARLLIYFTIGNFYMMNIVFVLQLLHISNRFTLIFFTVVPAAWAEIRQNGRKPLKALKEEAGRLRKLVEGKLGMRSYLTKVFSAIGKFLVKLLRAGAKKIAAHFVEVLLFIGLFVLLWWQYGQNLITNYGYCASDIPVHNYWINYLSRGKIFVAGVYPFGFHCIIYYLHAVFGFETYVLLRVFCFVQTAMVHYILLLFLRACCKSKYIPYIGVVFYLTGDFFSRSVISRYYSSLPQEFGMLFILPAIYFLFAFFGEKKQELDEAPAEEKLSRKEKKQKAREQRAVRREQREQKKQDAQEMRAARKAQRMQKKQEAQAAAAQKKFVHRMIAIGKNVLSEAGKDVKKRISAAAVWVKAHMPRVTCQSGFSLLMFAFSFSMTLAVHFYGTMIAGIFCLGIAVGFCFRLFRKPYFGKVMAAGILSVSIAVLPMAIAFVTGTPLQGSLGWGMNIITGKGDTEATATSAPVQTEAADVSKESATEATVPGKTVETAQSGIASSVGETPKQTAKQVKELGFLEKLKNKGAYVIDQCISVMREYVLLSEMRDYYWILSAFLGALLVLGVLYIIFDRLYAGMLFSTAFYLLFMLILMASGRLGLPALMQPARSSIYFTYSLPLALCFVADSILYLLIGKKKRGWPKRDWPLQLISFCGLGAFCVMLVRAELVRTPSYPQALETNEAVTCLTNIMHDNEDFKWTIVSANDEYRMAEDYGWHYELSDFLSKMEYSMELGNVKIPTQYVYFFIEKKPLDYAVHYEGSGQKVSRKGADNRLPLTGGLGMYQGEKRWIMMSRFYYWAKQFQKMFPNELKVYYETDNFVCYYIEQNPYRVYNFAIDYGFNAFREEPEETEEAEEG